MSSSFYTNSRQYRDIAEQAADAAAISAASAEISAASAASNANDAANALQAVVDASTAAAASALAAETSYQNTLVVIAGVDADVAACADAVISAQTYASNAAGSAATASAQALLADASADAAALSETAAAASAVEASASASAVADALTWVEGTQQGVNDFLNPAFLFSEDLVDDTTDPANGTYVAASWRCVRDTTLGSFTLGRVASGVTIQVPGDVLRLNITALLGGGTGRGVGFAEYMEDVRTYAEKYVALSIHVRNAGANNFNLRAEAIQSFGTGGTPSANEITQSTVNGGGGYTIAPGAEGRYTFHIAVPSMLGMTIGTDGWYTTYTAFRFWTSTTALSDIQFRAAQLEVVGSMTAPAAPFWMPPVGTQRLALDRLVRTLVIKRHVGMETSTTTADGSLVLSGPLPRRAATITVSTWRYFDGSWRTTGTFGATHTLGEQTMAWTLTGSSVLLLGGALMLDFTVVVDARF
jgi:hypothetical protein